MLKNKLEALLFSSGRKMNVEELSKLTNSKADEIKSLLSEMKNEYDAKNSSMMLVNEGTSWKLTVREKFLSLVQKIVTETELSKTVMETLAVIAFKYPIKQSDLIHIRTNKAYDHLKELEEMGYITRKKHGRTNLIKLAQKFFEYFDLPEEKLKEQFSDFESIAKAIEHKEKEIDSIRADQKQKAEEEKQKDEKIKETIGSLETYEEAKKEENPEAPKGSLGELEVVDEPSDEELEENRKDTEEAKKEITESQENASITETQDTEETADENEKESKENLEAIEDIEKIIDEKVERILHPKPEGETDDEFSPDKAKDKEENEGKEEDAAEEEEKDLLEASMDENEKKEEDEDSKKQ